MGVLVSMRQPLPKISDTWPVDGMPIAPLRRMEKTSVSPSRRTPRFHQSQGSALVKSILFVESTR